MPPSARGAGFLCPSGGSMMKSPIKFFAGAAAGVFALGAATGWVAPAILRSAQAADVATSLSGPQASAPQASAPSAPIPLGTAPNYRAIVAQNRDSVVGIT